MAMELLAVIEIVNEMNVLYFFPPLSFSSSKKLACMFMISCASLFMAHEFSSAKHGMHHSEASTVAADKGNTKGYMARQQDSVRQSHVVACMHWLAAGGRAAW